MSRLFYAAPFRSAESWNFEIYVAYSSGYDHFKPGFLKPLEEILASSLQLWATQVINYPLELPKEDRAAAALFETSLCQTIVDLWRWRLGDAVSRHHTWSEQMSSPPRLSLISSSGRRFLEDEAFMIAGDEIYQSDLMLSVPARDLVVMDMNCEDICPLGHLKAGMKRVVDDLVTIDEGRIQQLQSSNHVTEHPNSADACGKTKAIIKVVAEPLLLKTTKQPGPNGFRTELFFWQRQGFFQVSCDAEAWQR